MISQKYVKELFDYKDGYLIHKKERPGAKIGHIVGSLTDTGYLLTRIYGQGYKVHRLIFLWYYGYMPENCIDHIDKNPLNNKIENLRETSQRCNMRNARTSKVNMSGIKGVYFNKQRQKWTAQIQVNKKSFHLGLSSSLLETACMRLAAEQCLDWLACDSESSAYGYIKKFININ